jgi:hypothetical protein
MSPAHVPSTALVLLLCCVAVAATNLIYNLTIWQVFSVGLQQPEPWAHVHATWHRLAVGPQQEAAAAGEAESCRHWLQVGAQQGTIHCQQRAARCAKAGSKAGRKAQTQQSSQC